MINQIPLNYHIIEQTLLKVVLTCDNSIIQKYIISLFHLFYSYSLIKNSRKRYNFYKLSPLNQVSN